MPPENGVESLNTDRAIIAGADFDSWTYRTGFDVALPFLGYIRDEKMKSLSKHRKWVLKFSAFFQRNNWLKTIYSHSIHAIFSRSFWLTASTLKLSDVHLSTMIDLVSKCDRKILLLGKCPKKVAKRTVLGVRCAHGTTKTHDIKSVYAQSTFCLIAKTERLFQLNLVEALAANCIPVIFADNIVMPFSEVIQRNGMFTFSLIRNFSLISNFGFFHIWIELKRFSPF